MSLTKAVPTTDYVTDDLGTAKQSWNDTQAILRTLRDRSLPVTVTLTGSNLTPASSSARTRVNPADPDVNVVATVTTTAGVGPVDGATFVLMMLTNPVVLQHGNGSSGTLNLFGGADISLTEPEQEVVFQRRGNVFYEVSRSRFSAALSRLDQQLDANGQAIFNVGRRKRTDPAATVVITTADKDRRVWVTNSNATVQLPTDPTGWDDEDEVILVQRGTNMTIAPATNVRNALNHVRGFGQYARVACIVADSSVTPMIWDVVGLTKADDTPGATNIDRTYASAIFSDVLTTTSLTPVTAHTLTHTPASGEKWLYLAMGKVSSASANSSSRAKYILREDSDNQAQAATRSSPRYATSYEPPGLVMGKAYGPSPGVQNILLEHASGNGDVCTTEGGSILGLRLETGDLLNLQTAGATAATAGPDHTVLVDGFNYTVATEATDYLLLAWCNYAISPAGFAGTRFQVTHEANTIHDRTHGKDSLNSSFFLAMQPISYTTALTRTFKIRMASAVGTTTTTISGAGICLLKLSNFEHAVTNQAVAEQTSLSTTFANRVQIPATAYLSTYDYLALGFANLGTAADANTQGAQSKLTMTGPGDLTYPARTVSRSPGTYGTDPVLHAKVYRPTGSPQVLALQWANVVTDSNALIADANVAMLALKKVA